MLTDSFQVSPAVFSARTGWEIKPEGLCKGSACVPVDGVNLDGKLDLVRVAPALGMAMVEDPDSGVSAIGPESSLPVLATYKAPDLELPDVDGNPWRLKAMWGKKTLLVAWASW